MDGALVPPKGLRWEDLGPVAANLRPARSRAVFHLAGAAWNLALPGLYDGLGGAHLFAFSRIGLGFSAAFLLLALRAFRSRQRIVFDGGWLRVNPQLFAFWKRFDVALVDVTGFDVQENDDGTCDVFAVLSGGSRQRIPFDRETILLSASWNKAKLFAAPRSHAEFIAARLGQMLDGARRSGHDTYRS